MINTVTSIPENTSTAVPIKLADISITDDGLGTNDLTVSGADAGSFQIVGIGLYLKAGTSLNFVTKPSYTVAVNVDDKALGPNPDASSAAFVLTITAPTSGTPTLIISEVAPWSSGNSNTPLQADWFEVTNIGTAAQNITGWKVDDNSNSFGSALTLNGITNVAPGESVIFIETVANPSAAQVAAVKAAFNDLWFGANSPPNLQIGNYGGSGVGLSTDPGDAVNLFNAAGVVQTRVDFGVSTPGPTFRSFDNAAGINNVVPNPNVGISTLSAVGVNGAFAAVNPLSGKPEIGSPGTIGAPPTPLVSITATDANAAETGSDPGSFRISRTGSTVGPLNVNYTIATGVGQATSADYTPALTGSVTIASGQSFADITITPIDDTLFETSETVTVTLSDSGSYDVGAPSTATVTIADNDVPDTAIDSAPGNPTNTTNAHFAFRVSNAGSGIATFECSLDSPTFSPCTSPFDQVQANGSHTFKVRAIGNGIPDPTPASFTWTVDTVAPGITCAATPDTLWPANGKLVAVSATVNVSDALSGPAANVKLVSATSNEPDSGGDIQGFTVGTSSTTGFLRASRLGSGSGHVYSLTYTGSDRAGNTASCIVTVLVPHDQGNGK